MIIKILTLSLGCAVLSSTGFAAEPDISKLPKASDKRNVTFDTDIKPFVEASCVKCHSGEKPKGKYRVDTKENFLKGGGGDEKPVVMGDSAKSPVIHYVADLVADSEMPPLDKRDK